MTAFRLLLLLGCSAILLAQPGEYAGPSILSRGLSPSNPGGAANITFRPYISASGIYETGLTGLIVDSEGNLHNVATIGVDAQIGVYGFHNWRRTTLGLDYRGIYRHYSRHTYYDGTDQFLTLGFTRQVSKRTQFTLRENAGTYSRNYLLLSASGFMDPGLVDTPTNELFDNRVFYVSTAGDLTYMKSPRLSFNMGGNGFLVRRRSSALYGVTGASARGDVGYRLSRFSTVGVGYNFTHLEFTRAFGASDLHALGINYSLRLSRNWELGTHIGAIRSENLFIGSVAIDPAIAALTGQTTGFAANYQVHYHPNLIGRLHRRFPHAALQFEYRRTVSAGNGLFLTSAQEAGSASYSYTGIRKWHFALNASIDRYVALAQSIGKYRSYTAGLGITRQLGRSLSLILRGDERWYEAGLQNFNRHASRVSLGFAWSPGDVPLSLW